MRKLRAKAYLLPEIIACLKECTDQLKVSATLTKIVYPQDFHAYHRGKAVIAKLEAKDSHIETQNITSRRTDMEKIFQLRFGRLDELHEALKQAAFDAKVSMNTYILDAIKAQIDKQQPKKEND